MGTDSLGELLIAAGEAPPDVRITYRDPIARHGVDAIHRLMEPEWIGDPTYAAFAIRAIARAGEMGPRGEAIVALRRAQSLVEAEHHRADISAMLATLGPVGRSAGARASSAARPAAPPIDLDDLVVDRCYRRRDLHDGGLGGNRQKGISYPARGTHCLLFSDPSKAGEHGYRDEPVGQRGYRYFGEWDGSGDMTMTGGNQAILDRSPELYLFTKASCGHVYRGRFQCTGTATEATTRDGRQYRAIVFRLERLDAR